MTENQNPDNVARGNESQPGGTPWPPATPTAAGAPKRRIPLVPAVLAGSALFIVGGLAGGAVGASAVMAPNGSETSQGPGGQGGMGGPGGAPGGGSQQGGGNQQGGSMPGDGNQQDNQQDGDRQNDTQQGNQQPDNEQDGTQPEGTQQDNQSDDGDIENAAVTHFEQIFTGFAVLNRDG